MTPVPAPAGSRDAGAMARPVVRTVVTVVLVLAWLLAVAIGWLYLGFPGWQGGWLWSVIAFCGVPAAIVWFRTPTSRPAGPAVAAAAAVGLVLTVFAVA